MRLSSASSLFSLKGPVGGLGAGHAQYLVLFLETLTFWCTSHSPPIFLPLLASTLLRRSVSFHWTDSHHESEHLRWEGLDPVFWCSEDLDPVRSCRVRWAHPFVPECSQEASGYTATSSAPGGCLVATQQGHCFLFNLLLSVENEDGVEPRHHDKLGRTAHGSGLVRNRRE